MVSREFRPLLACSGRFGCGPQRRTRWGGAFVSTLPLWFRGNSVAFRRSRCGFARIPFCGFARIPASSGVFWPLLASCGGPLSNAAATAHAVGRCLRFNAPAVVSREFRCVSRLPLWFRANPLLFDAPAVLFSRVLASSGLFGGAADLFWGGRLGCRPQGASRCGFARIPLHFDAPAVVSREFRCVSTLLLRFHANSGLFWRALASSGLFWGGRLGCGPQRRTQWGGALVSTLPQRFRANSVAFRRSRCGFARIPLRFDAPAVVSREFRPSLACSGLFRGGHLGSHKLLHFWSPGVSVFFGSLFWPPLASSGPPHCLGSMPA